MTCSWSKLRASLPACLGLLTALFLASCSSNHNIKGIPDQLPVINLASSSVTPPHHLASYEYPFDSNGQYISDWAAEGERRVGRGPATEESSKPKVFKISRAPSSSRSKSTASSRNSKSGSGSKSKSGKTASKSSGGGSRYTVKKGDTLSAIAQRNGTTVAKLKSANGLSSNNIGIGKVLRVPK